MTAPAADREHGPLFWAGAVVGFAVMIFGAAGFLDDVTDSGQRVNFAVWVVGLDLLHDLVVAPVACLIGVVLTSRLPAAWRAPVRFGLFASAVMLFLAWSPLRNTADVTGNPTIQPLDYTTATLTVLAVVWAIALAWLGWRLLASNRRQKPASRADNARRFGGEDG